MHDIITLPAARNPASRRNILLLQGMVGPFFRRIAKALSKAGFGVLKINFNGGDRLFWAGCGGGIDYTGTHAAWPDFLERIISQKQITDVVLFGDCRPLHRAAISLCRNLEIPVHVCDEGYIRPDWITFELGGVNGHSRLPKDPDFYIAQARNLRPLPSHPAMPSSFQRRAREAVLYAAANFLLQWHFPHWKTHRPWTPVQEGLGWLQRLSKNKAASTRSASIMARLEANADPYMLFPLQLDSDAQIRFHSPFANMIAALQKVMDSFAAFAAPPLRLVIKAHPLDNGLTNWAVVAKKMATRLGVADRVDFLETGDIAKIVQAARGLVTVNSTTGTLALASEVPVITLGHAIYNMPGITYQGGLEAFWNAPGRPNGAIFAAFRRVLIENCLVAGGFFSESALILTVQGVVERFKSSCYPGGDYHVEPAYFTQRQAPPLPRVTIP